MSYVPSFRISGAPQDSARLTYLRQGPPQDIHPNKLVPTDPKIWGPITWYNIHTMAFVINKESEIPVFIKLLRSICDKIPCHTCKEHAKMFLESNPPETSIGNTPSNCFRYTVDFHNHANLITGKSLLSYEDAFKLYNKTDEGSLLPPVSLVWLGVPLTGVSKISDDSKISKIAKVSSKPYSPVRTMADLNLSSAKQTEKKSKSTSDGGIQEVRKLDSSFFD